MKYKWTSEKKRDTQKLKEEKGEENYRLRDRFYMWPVENLVLTITALCEMLCPYILYFRIK